MFENSVHYLSWADRPALNQCPNEYDSVILPSHLVLAAQGTVPTFVNTLSDDHDIDFYIDPAITQLRAGDNFRKSESGELRSWISQMVGYHGDAVERILEQEQNLKYPDLSDSEAQALVESVCEFQENFIEDAADQAAGKYVTVSDLKPNAVIPWYIKIRGYSDIMTNEKIIKYAKQATDLPLRPCIFVTKQFINDVNARKSITEMLDENDISEVFLWIEDLDNSEGTDITDYLNATRLVKRCSDSEIDPHLLYGSYFANLLAYFGLKGVGFGVNHSESKEEKLENRGGGGDSRYYFESAKVFLSPPEAVRIAEAKDAPPCNCSICKPTVSSWDDVFQLADDQSDLQEHYISCRNQHSSRIRSADLETLLDKVEAAYDIYGSLLGGTDSSKDALHLKKWHLSIRKFVEHDTDKTLDDYKGGLATLSVP